MPQINLAKIISRLKEKPDKKFPLKFELDLRRDIVAKLEDGAGIDEIEKIKEITIFLDGKRDSEWAYERDIAGIYYKYFKKLIPEDKFNWQFELPDYYIAVALTEGHWVYYRIYPAKRQIQRILPDHDNMSTSFKNYSLKNPK